MNARVAAGDGTMKGGVSGNSGLSGTRRVDAAAAAG
jgi:hypothetical protein